MSSFGSNSNSARLRVGTPAAYQFSTLLATDWKNVVPLVPLPEGSGVNDDDGVLYQSLGTHQLVAAGVVHDVDDASLARDSFGTPGKVAGVQAQSPKISKN